MWYNKKRKRFQSVFLGTDEGKWVLGQLYKMCGYQDRIFSPDPQTTAFNAGRHQIAQKIAVLLNQSEEDVQATLKESRLTNIMERQND